MLFMLCRANSSSLVQGQNDPIYVFEFLIHNSMLFMLCRANSSSLVQGQNAASAHFTFARILPFGLEQCCGLLPTEITRRIQWLTQILFLRRLMPRQNACRGLAQPLANAGPASSTLILVLGCLCQICDVIFCRLIRDSHSCSFPYLFMYARVHTYISQRTRHINPTLEQCCPTVYDVGPAMVQHWIDVSCLLGYYQ